MGSLGVFGGYLEVVAFDARQALTAEDAEDAVEKQGKIAIGNGSTGGVSMTAGIPRSDSSKVRFSSASTASSALSASPSSTHK